MEMLKSLADKTRLRIVRRLMEGDLTVNELAGELGISQYNVSKHLRILRHGGIIGLRQMGRQREYFVVQEFRQRLAKNKNTLDLGCCVFRFDQLAE